MLCPTCNTDNPNKNSFCSRCGATLPTVTESLSDKFSAGGNLSEAASSAWFGVEIENLSGRTLDGKYRLEAKLGTGGAGAVYLATRLHIGDKVAVKILRSDKSDDPQAAERFRLEARMAAHLKHPNAVAIYDYGVTVDALGYLVMEFVEGKTVRQLIEHHGALPSTLIVEINTQVCAALDEAHRIGLIHRDIKPDNIIVQETSAGLRVKVLDFGIAKLSSLGASNLTQTGTIVGTPRYMSPEQCMGEQIDGRSDIYSLGIVLYETLCGIVPFNAPSSTAIAIQQVTQQPQPLREINPNVLASVERIVMQTLEKKREARPATAEKFSRDFSAAFSRQQFTQQGVQFNFSGLSTNESAQTISTSEKQSPTVFIPPASGERRFESNPVFMTNAQQPPETKRSRVPMFIAAALGFLFFGVVGATAMWFFLRAPAETIKTKDGKAVTTGLKDTKDANVNNNAAPPVSAADEELTRLRDERRKDHVHIDELKEKIHEAEDKFPNDYRFPLEFILVSAIKTDSNKPHHSAYEELSDAARIAIKNNQAGQMAEDLESYKENELSLIAQGHKEWAQIENALNQKDENLLPKDEH